MKNMNPDRIGIYLKFSGFNPVCNYANQLVSTKKKPDKHARAQGIEVCSFALLLTIVRLVARCKA